MSKSSTVTLVVAGALLCWLVAATGYASDKITVLRAGGVAGHYLSWKGRPILLVGDSVTQGWMECGTNFDQCGYVEALARRGINLLMLWSFKGTDARRQQQDKRLGYDAPELWPWAGSPEARSFDLHRFNPAYFDRLSQLVADAESRRMVVLITVHDGWTKTCFDGHPFNPHTGEFRSAPAVAGGNRKQEFEPPFAGDAALHLKRLP